MPTLDDLINCAGWQAVNRIRTFSNMHNIFQQNHLELNNLLIKIQHDIQLSNGTIKETWKHLEQRVFNYLSSASALENPARKMMKFYDGKGVYLEYSKKIKLYFEEDPLSQFTKKLRNYQNHCKITPITFSHTGKSLSVVFYLKNY